MYGYRCDRCGAEHPVRRPVVAMLEMSPAHWTSIVIYPPHGANPARSRHLCRACSAALDDWLEMEPMR